MKQDVAVALKYPENAQAPVICAKTKGLLAERMKEIAVKENIPVVEDELLANTLSFVEIGECIPEETWQAVAGVFAMIMELEKHDY